MFTCSKSTKEHQNNVWRCFIAFIVNFEQNPYIVIQTRYISKHFNKHKNEAIIVSAICLKEALDEEAN